MATMADRPASRKGKSHPCRHFLETPQEITAMSDKPLHPGVEPQINLTINLPPNAVALRPDVFANNPSIVLDLTPSQAELIALSPAQREQRFRETMDRLKELSDESLAAKNLAKSDQILEAIRAQQQDPPRSKRKRSLTANRAAIRLARTLLRPENKRHSKISVALDYCNGDKRRAQSLLRTIRRHDLLKKLSAD
jgi:hypothetical protein